MMIISRIDHVSLAVNDFEKAEKFFETIFGVVSGAAEEDRNMKYFWNIFSIGDLSRMELMRATEPGSFLDNFLASRKDGGVHHITLETPDIRSAKAHLEKHNIPYFGYSDQNEKWKEMFIHPKDAFGVLIQIAQMRDPNDYLADSVKHPGKKRWSADRIDNEVKLSLPHPGGGKVEVHLTAHEAAELADDLKKAAE